MAVKAGDETKQGYVHPLYHTMLSVPGLSAAVASVDQLLTWGLTNSLWVFPMATSCCGIELMAAAASRVDLDRMGVIVRGTPRQADVMVVAGTITVKMAPRVKKLWDMMPEPKWCIAMGSCAISGDFYRDLYPTVPGIDTFMPVDVYIPGCPPNPEALMHGLMRLQDKVRQVRAGTWIPPEERPEYQSAHAKIITPAIRRLNDTARDPVITRTQQERAARLCGSDVLEERPIPARAVEAPVAPLAAPAEIAEGPAGHEALLRAYGATEFPKDAPPLIPLDQHRALAAAAKERGYRLLSYVVASHWPAQKDKAGEVLKPERFEVTYGLRTPGRASRLLQWRLQTEAGPDGVGTVDSLWGLFAGADWHEREQYDLVGVVFAGHPDLRRILLPHDYQGHPLRRDAAADAPCAPWR